MRKPLWSLVYFIADWDHIFSESVCIVQFNCKTCHSPVRWTSCSGGMHVQIVSPGLIVTAWAGGSLPGRFVAQLDATRVSAADFIAKSLEMIELAHQHVKVKRCYTTCSWRRGHYVQMKRAPAVVLILDPPRVASVANGCLRRNKGHSYTSYYGTGRIWNSFNSSWLRNILDCGSLASRNTASRVVASATAHSASAAWALFDKDPLPHRSMSWHHIACWWKWGAARGKVPITACRHLPSTSADLCRDQIAFTSYGCPYRWCNNSV